MPIGHEVSGQLVPRCLRVITTGKVLELRLFFVVVVAERISVACWGRALQGLQETAAATEYKLRLLKCSHLCVRVVPHLL